MISRLPANDNDGDDFLCDAAIMEIVEERLADMFVWECHSIAAELGLETIHGAYSDEDAAKINAEFDDRYKAKSIASAFRDRRHF